MSWLSFFIVMTTILPSLPMEVGIFVWLERCLVPLPKPWNAYADVYSIFPGATLY